MSTSILCDYSKNPESPLTEENSRTLLLGLGATVTAKRLFLPAFTANARKRGSKRMVVQKSTKDEPPHVEWRVVTV
jgi:hypothetical protein